jgi:hypothetical protein
MASSTERNQISFGIVAECATSSQVVNIEILKASTSLTAPVVTHQDFFTQLRIWNGRYPNSRPLSQDGVAHRAFSAGFDGPGAFGRRLKVLGFVTEPRDAKGKKLRLTEAVRNRALQLAHDLDIPEFEKLGSSERSLQA